MSPGYPSPGAVDPFCLVPSLLLSGLVGYPLPGATQYSLQTKAAPIAMAEAMPMKMNMSLLDNVDLALHEKLVGFVENVQHVILVVVARVLAASCPIPRQRTFLE